MDMGKEDSEDGKGASGSVGRRMPTSGRTREEDTWKEQPGASES